MQKKEKYKQQNILLAHATTNNSLVPVPLENSVFIPHFKLLHVWTVCLLRLRCELVPSSHPAD